MLAVDIDEDVAGLAQQLYRHRLPVQVGARAPVRSHDPAHGELAAAADGLLVEPLLQLVGGLAQLEGAGDFRALGAVAHHLGTGAASGEQLQRVHQDRFARAGLAGEHRQAATQLELHRVDDGEVADLQVGEQDRKSTRLNSSHSQISYAVFCLKKKKQNIVPESLFG